MAKAGRVSGIRPRQSLRDNAQKVIDARLEEFLSWRSALTDPTEVQALHDMRIAAKRLRYALEIFELCFPDTKPLIKEITRVQEDLGEIHDLDVLTDLMRDRLRRHGVPLTQKAVEVTETAANRSEQMNRLRAALYAQARDPRRLGLLALIGDQVMERRKRYETFSRHWGGKRLDRFASEVRVGTGLVDTTEPDSAQVAGGNAV